MIIIVEGPDGAGKTTIIKQLMESHPGSSYRHFSNPKTEEEANNYWKVYAEAISLADPAKVHIFDRSWYSDVVYGPIFRGRLEMDPMHVKMLEALVKTHGGGFVLYCTAALKTLWSRCKQRGETFVLSKDKLDEVSKSYAHVMATQCGLPVVRYDTGISW